jgi:hypothetical protein
MKRACKHGITMFMVMVACEFHVTLKKQVIYT